jgi:hypothetical protein
MKMIFWRKISLKMKLTIWYCLGLSFTFFLFSTYLYLAFRHGLIRQIDSNLKTTATEIKDIIIEENQQFKLDYRKTKSLPKINQNFDKTGIVISLIDKKGKSLIKLGSAEIKIALLPQNDGLNTRNYHGQNWRIYSKKIAENNWLQIAQSLQNVDKVSQHLLTLFLLSFPIIIIILIAGGWLLLDRALYPINQIILTTEAISPDDFTQRINSSGKFDEIGRLEITINRMLDRLQTAFEYERRFTANVSHELRTPLTIMKGKIDVTLNRDRSAIEYHKIFKDLEQEVYRLIRLVNGLLFLVRLEQEEVEHYWQFSLVNISDLLEILVEQFEDLNSNNNIRISAKIQPNLWLDGNADYLTNLFLNLLDNAIKYTPSGEQVLIAVYQQKNRFIATITNTGHGIAKGHLPYLFERFYRVNDSNSQAISGTGLGLAIAQEITHLHKGTITVDSQTQGEIWTSFKLNLPIHQQI